jgi:hypothetical protein
MSRDDARRSKHMRTFLVAIVALVTLGGVAAAGASSRGRAPANDTWRTECGACHVAYPPRLLPARSWRAIMGGLDKHFGTDATVDAPAAAEIGSFLEQNAGRDREATTSLRITETARFLRKHRKIPAAVWSRPAVKTRANCSACHPGAEGGSYDDDSITISR